ncbi:MAG: polysaccharide deacetylase family protein [Clostridia bacterium]
MGIFHNREQYEGYNIYSMKKYVDKKRMIFTITAIIAVIVTLSLTIFYLLDTTIRVKKSKEFAKQIEEFEHQQQQEEEKKKKEEEEARQAKIPKLTEQGKENLKNIYHTEEKVAYLTFDDGPSNNTHEILDILKQYNIKATFFVLGSQVEVFPETTNRIYNEGHYIANHGYSHKYSSIYHSPENVLNEFNQCNQIVAKTINVPEYNSHLFRFPGGLVGGKYAEIKKQAEVLLEQNDILHIDWNSLTGDSEKSKPTEDYLMNNLQKTTAGKNSLVVLMHDAQAKHITVETLPKVIDYLQQQGYTFKNFYEIIK